MDAQLFGPLLHLGERAEARDRADRALTLARSTVTATEPRARAYATAVHARHLQEGGLDEDLVREAPELWSPIDALPIGAWPSMTLAGDLVTIGHLGRARDLIDTMLGAATDRGDDGASAELLDHLARLEAQSGAWRAGLAAARTSSALAEELYGFASARARVAWFEAAMGDGPAALLDAHAVLARDGAEPDVMVWATSALALLALSEGRPEESLASLEAVLAVTPEPGRGDPGTMWFLPDLVASLTAVGRADDAAPYVDWLEERGRSLDRPSAAAAGARGRGLLRAADGDLAGAEASLDTALAAIEPPDLPYDRARTLLALGEVRRRSGRKRLARDALTAAADIFDGLGAIGWRARVDAELGHLSGRRPAAGALTDAEGNVARLAAAGLRNREIAAQLSISVRTVEGHLSDAYGKLGVRSRTELAIFFEADDARLEDDPG